MPTRSRKSPGKAKPTAEVIPATGKTLAEVRSLLGPAWIIEGEDPETYERLLVGVANAIGPRDLVEWLLIKDVVALSWEIQRGRRISESLLALYRREAMESILARLMPKSPIRSIREPYENLAEKWAEGQKAAEAQVDALFDKAGYSAAEVDAQALTEHADEFDRIDARTARCEERRDKLLQQIERRRAGSAKDVLDAGEGVIEAEFEVTPPKGAKSSGREQL